MTRRHVAACNGVPRPTSPISHAVVVGRTCWISGQHALDGNGQYCPGSASEEALRCFELLFRIARSVGFSPDEFVFIDIAFADLADIAAVNRVFESQFPAARRPARAVHQAAGLAFGARIRVQGTASR